jgi:hypothetical protein
MERFLSNWRSRYLSPLPSPLYILCLLYLRLLTVTGYLTPVVVAEHQKFMEEIRARAAEKKPLALVPVDLGDDKPKLNLTLLEGNDVKDTGLSPSLPALFPLLPPLSLHLLSSHATRS